MNFRPAFWPGFLLGALTAFAACFRKPVPALPAAPSSLLDFVSEAVIACDASGQRIDANAAARALFGADLAGYQSLGYPTGQPVPPGQLPLARLNAAPAHYLLTDTSCQTRTLEVTTRPLPTGGAAAVFQDVTAHTEAETKDAQARADTDALHTLSRRLGLAKTAEEVADAAAEAALALGAETARCFLYDGERKLLTQAAVRPDTRPQRPQTQQAARPITVALNAADPRHWAVYVAKEAFEGAGTLALPLLAGGRTEGHLEVSAVREGGRDALTLVGLLTGAALAARREAAQAQQAAAREAALGEITVRLAQAAPFDDFCDAVAACVRRLLDAEACTITVRGRLRGQDYLDALLRPEQHTPEDPALRHEAAEAATASGETTQRTNLPSPDFASGIWSAFAGASGKHRVLAVPLTGKHAPGALTVWAEGEGVFLAAQISFAETLAALLSAHPATETAKRPKPRTSPGPAGAD